MGPIGRSSVTRANQHYDVLANLSWFNAPSCEHGPVAALGGVEMAMEVFLCPMCSRALTINTIEPHPIRDRVVTS
jgi:hypothetical protein